MIRLLVGLAVGALGALLLAALLAGGLVFYGALAFILDLEE